MELRHRNPNLYLITSIEYFETLLLVQLSLLLTVLLRVQEDPFFLTILASSKERL